MVVAAWNIMDGEVRVEALNDVCELLGCGDPEALMRGLIQIREAKKPSPKPKGKK